MVAATSRTSSRSSPWRPSSTTSSPGETSRPVTSTGIMSIETRPTIGTRRPRTSTHAPVAEAPVEAVGVPGRHDGERPRTVGAERLPVADRFAVAETLDRNDA